MSKRPGRAQRGKAGGRAASRRRAKSDRKAAGRAASRRRAQSDSKAGGRAASRRRAKSDRKAGGRAASRRRAKSDEQAERSRTAGHRHAVILAGGAGERFWPASRQKHPKPFLKLFGNRTLLDDTLARARRFGGPDRVWVVCGREHAAALRRATGLPARRVLVEPERRNTAMAAGWAAHCVIREDPEAVMAVLPADHVLPDGKSFQNALARADAAARGEGALVTIGVKPTRPEVGYGYIHVGAAAGGYPGLHRVRRFVEKPDLARARRYLRHGGYLWNAGIFVWTARTLLEEIETWAPDLHRALAPVAAARSPRSPSAVGLAYRKAPSLPVDIAVMERSRRVWTLLADFHWSDVGTWESLAEELGVRPGTSRVVAGDLAFDDPGGNLVWGDGRPIALLGVEGLAVIDTGDALLVARLDRGAEVRRVVAELKASGRGDVT